MIDSGIYAPPLHQDSSPASLLAETGDAAAELPPRLDEATLAGLAELGRSCGRDLLRQVAELFLQTGEERVAALRRSCLDGSLEDLRRNAHALKGGASQLGALRLAALCAELEGAARCEEPEECLFLVAEVRREHQQTASELRLRVGL
jgi:HPt (histidine-containing phosphotransfer) domain-containing protein